MQRRQSAPAQATRHNRTKPAPLDRSTVALTVSDEDVRAMLNISRTHAYKLRKTDPDFPKPLTRLGTKRLWYARAAVEGYVAKLAAEAASA